MWTWIYSQVYTIITSSNLLHALRIIHRFLHISILLKKIELRPDAMRHSWVQEETNMDKYEMNIFWILILWYISLGLYTVRGGG